MAEHPNVELVRRGYEAFASGDLATLTSLFADGIVWHNPGRNPLAGDRKGRDEVFALFGELQQLTEGSFQLAIHDILGNDDHVVALVESSQTKPRSATLHQAHIFHVRDGQVVEFWNSFTDQYLADESLTP